MSASNSEILLCADEFYFLALFDYDESFPISDEKYAHELFLQEALVSSSSSSSSIITARKITQNPEKTKRVLAGESSHSFCAICMDVKSSSEMFEESQCSHRFCNYCIERYVATRVKENASTIDCPEPRCKADLEPYSLRPILPEEVFERWERVISESLISASEKFYCPFSDCSAMLLHEEPEKVRLTQSECPFCNRLFCAQCKVPWHAGACCDEFQMMSDNKRAEMAVVKLAKDRKWQQCPKCKYYVEKVDGCRHISCRCGAHFCYGCGSAWNESHSC